MTIKIIQLKVVRLGESKIPGQMTKYLNFLPTLVGGFGEKGTNFPHEDPGMGVSSNGGTPKTPKMIIFSRKTWVPPF